MKTKVEIAKNRWLPIRLYGVWLAPVMGDLVYETLKKRDPFESREVHFVESFLVRGQSFWDIGANFGLYSLIAAKLVGIFGSVVAVEPDPKNLRRLRLNLWLNMLPQVRVLPFAASDDEAPSGFWSCTQGAYSGLKVAETPGVVQKIVVRQTQLDSIAAKMNWPEVDLLKMDVEGAELLVLKGGSKYFGEGPRPIVMCEFSDRRTCAYQYSAHAIADWLVVRNYQWYRFTESGKLASFRPEGQFDYENLIACPEEKSARLAKWVSVA